jgi:cyclase
MVLEAGADKVSMNSAAVKNPSLVRQAARKFGSDKITVAVDGRRNRAMASGFEVVVAGGTKPVGKDAVEWARKCEHLGAGVILPTSMDGDGTQAGFDIRLRKPSPSCGKCLQASGGKIRKIFTRRSNISKATIFWQNGSRTSPSELLRIPDQGLK